MQEIDKIFDLHNKAHGEIVKAKKLRESFWGSFPLTKPFVEAKANEILDGATVLVLGAATVTDQLKEKAEKTKSKK